MKDFTVLFKVKQKYQFVFQEFLIPVSHHLREFLHSLAEVLILLLKSSNLCEKSEVLLAAN